MTKRRVLFVSCSVGMGHVRAADALLSHLRLTHPEIEARHIDLVNFLSPLAKYFYFTSYGIMAKKAPKLWGFFYRATAKTNGAKRFNQLTKLNKKIGSKKFFKFIEKFQPDFILCTHFTPADLVVNHSRTFNITKKIGILLTDYTTHPLNFTSPNELYFVATPDMRENIINMGGRAENIIISGIPIDDTFTAKESVDDLKNRYHIDKNKPTILFLSGGDGFVQTDQAISTLFKSQKLCNIVAVAGKNEQLYKKLSQLSPPPKINYIVNGWTNKMNELMKMADLIVTKPGGLTITECLYLQKPMLIMDPVPGQEENNLKFLEKNHLGMELKLTNEIPEMIEKILSQKNIPSIPITDNPAKVIIDNIIKNLS